MLGRDYPISTFQGGHAVANLRNLGLKRFLQASTLVQTRQPKGSLT